MVVTRAFGRQHRFDRGLGALVGGTGVGGDRCQGGGDPGGEHPIFGRRDGRRERLQLLLGLGDLTRGREQLGLLEPLPKLVVLGRLGLQRIARNPRFGTGPRAGDRIRDLERARGTAGLDQGQGPVQGEGVSSQTPHSAVEGQIGLAMSFPPRLTSVANLRLPFGGSAFQVPVEGLPGGCGVPMRTLEKSVFGGGDRCRTPGSGREFGGHAGLLGRGAAAVGPGHRGQTGGAEHHAEDAPPPSSWP